MPSRHFALVLLLAGACAKTDTETQAPDPAPAEASETPAEQAAAPAEEAPEPADAQPEAEAPASKSLADVVAGLENGKTFAELVVAAELDKELRSSDISLTILVPTDEAFAKLPKGTLDKWKKNKDTLQKALKYHFIPGVNNAAKIGNYRTAPTAAGPELEVKTVQDSDMTIGGARLVESDMPAANGMVHLIDRVLEPGKKAK